MIQISAISLAYISFSVTEATTTVESPFLKVVMDHCEIKYEIQAKEISDKNDAREGEMKAVFNAIKLYADDINAMTVLQSLERFETNVVTNGCPSPKGLKTSKISETLGEKFPVKSIRISEFSCGEPGEKILYSSTSGTEANPQNYKQSAFTRYKHSKENTIGGVPVSVANKYCFVLLEMRKVVMNQLSRIIQFAGLENRNYISSLWLLPGNVFSSAKFFHPPSNTKDLHAVSFSDGLIVFKISGQDNKLEEGLMFRTNQGVQLEEDIHGNIWTIGKTSTDTLTLGKIEPSTPPPTDKSLHPNNFKCESIHPNYVRLAYHQFGPTTGGSYLTYIFRAEPTRVSFFKNKECDKAEAVSFLNGVRNEANRIAEYLEVTVSYLGPNTAELHYHGDGNRHPQMPTFSGVRPN